MRRIRTHPPPGGAIEPERVVSEIGAGALGRARFDARRHRLIRSRSAYPSRPKLAAHLLELLARNHLLGEQRGLDPVEEPLQPADQLGLGDPELCVARHDSGLERRGHRPKLGREVR